MQIKRNLGAACIVLGVLCVLVAAGLLVQNAWAERQAQQASSDAIAALNQLATMQNASQAQAAADAFGVFGASTGTTSTSGTANANVGNAIATATVDGAVYCGVLEIGAIGLCLPIQAEFSYAALKSSPCLYTQEGNDALVIAAHNYTAHFGNLAQLQPGDIICYTSLTGAVTQYAVSGVTTIEETDVDAIQGSADELILFTCNINNNSQRVVVRCTVVL